MSDPKYIYFNFKGYSASGKTKVWAVKTKDDLDELLGWVKWFSSWRCYAFYPLTLIEEELVFEKTCLRDIANFCEEQTKLHSQHKKELDEGLKRILSVNTKSKGH